ncbi:MAG TPA: glycosyltransferase [Thermoanaerobaculia bacterium]|nr:glycosyltransferase [Thermoanaerobaculia bacterium]
MKVLMVGWEFPPHISGGLGTACQGISQGLAHHGVDITFVVPHRFGDEDTAPGVRLIDPGPPRRPVTSIADAPATGETPEESASAGFAPREARAASYETVAVAGDPSIANGEESPTVLGALRVLGIDSSLRPYLDAGGYAHMVDNPSEEETSSSTAPAAASYPGMPKSLRPYLRRHAAATAVENPEHAPPEVPPEVSGSLSDSDALVSTTPAPTSPRPLEPVSLGLTRDGRYARDLFAEVARFTLAVGELAMDEDFDLVHAHDWMTYPGAILAARRRGKPLVVHVHSCEYDRSGDGADRRIVEIEQAGLDAADRVVCVSHYTSGVVTSRYRVDPSKIRVVHNAVTQRDQVEELHLEKAIDEPIVLFLGRVTFQKGPDYFLQAAARVVREEPRVRFVLGGTGDMLPTMIEESARMRLQRHLSFTGFLSGIDVERMYALADIYVMPSVSEPFGIAPLEAMALDVPVIVSRQSGVAEILEHALKVDFWDVEEIANKILALLRQPALRRQLVEDGRGEVARMRWELRGQLLRDVYTEILGERAAT